MFENCKKNHNIKGFIRKGFFNLGTINAVKIRRDAISFASRLRHFQCRRINIDAGYMRTLFSQSNSRRARATSDFENTCSGKRIR